MLPVGLCRCNLETVDVLELLLCRPCEYRRILDLFYSSQRYGRVHIALEHRCYLFQIPDPPSLRSSLRDFLTKVASLLPLGSVLFRKSLAMGEFCDTVMEMVQTQVESTHDSRQVLSESSTLSSIRTLE